MTAKGSARKRHASDVYTPENPVVVHRQAHAQQGWRPEIRPTHDDDKQRKDYANLVWARLLAKEKH